MKTFLIELRTSVVAIIVFAILLCGIYPLIVWAGGNLLFHNNAAGSLIERGGQTIGSEWIGQGFTSPRYFQSRPSAAGKGYDATSSSGSNLGPTSKKLMDAIAQNIDAYRKANDLAADVKIPADAVTASASGLDPHISPRNAELQTARIVRERKVPVEQVKSLIESNTEDRFLGFIGEPAVNVLTLNLALDRLNVP